MNDWILNNPYSTVVLAAYLFAAFYFRSKEANLMLLAFTTVIFIMPKVTWSGNDVIKVHLCYSMLYALTSWLLYYFKKYTSAFASIIMALFCSVYATDSWVNSDVETWLWRNYEIIVVTLHVVIMLSFSGKLCAMVDMGISNISGILGGNSFSSKNSNSHCRREINEEDTQ